MACDTPVKATAIFITELQKRTTTVTKKKKPQLPDGLSGHVWKVAVLAVNVHGCFCHSDSR